MANRDQSQKVAFVYSNIYQIYKKAKNEAENETAGLSSPKVFRADEVIGVKVTPFQPVEFKGATAPSAASPAPGVRIAKAINPFDDLKSNISKLQDLHSRLRFMLKELEDLVEKDKK